MLVPNFGTRAWELKLKRWEWDDGILHIKWLRMDSVISVPGLLVVTLSVQDNQDDCPSQLAAG